MPHNVRTYTRKTARGGTATVQQHTRTGNKAKPKVKEKRGPNPHHAGKLGKRGLSHGRRGNKGRAAALIGLAGIEVILWIALNGTAQIFTLVAAVLVGLAIVMVK